MEQFQYFINSPVRLYVMYYAHIRERMDVHLSIYRLEKDKLIPNKFLPPEPCTSMYLYPYIILTKRYVQHYFTFYLLLTNLIFFSTLYAPNRYVYSKCNFSSTYIYVCVCATAHTSVIRCVFPMNIGEKNRGFVITKKKSCVHFNTREYIT